ncbi:hypothetical protein LPJ66_001682 [Kickxella alabastrina]|uniref:Uncharacterized protein n=1 Tax=Kickxella alabastrina TaxID=61397 RepID=A0ACC1ISI4_9FUNG|nr:hypothetical protein LPJ66_001682 [Kickxella alabastrina]
MGIGNISQPTTRNNSAQSSPYTLAADVSAHLPQQQQQKQQRQKSQGRSRAPKSTPGTAVDGDISASLSSAPVVPPVTRTHSEYTKSTVDTAGSPLCKRSSSTHGNSTGPKPKGANSEGNSGGGGNTKKSGGNNNRIKDAQQKNGQSSEQGKGNGGKPKAQPPKQRRQNSNRDVNQQQQRQQQAHAVTPKHMQARPGMLASYSANDISSSSSYGWTKGHSKNVSVRSTDDDRSIGYGVHDGETDSEEDYDIGFSQEMWDLNVSERVILPTGLERTLTAQILFAYETRLCPTSESIEFKRAYIDKFATILLTEFPDWKIDIHVFGSSVNGLGTSRSDVDICLTTEHKELENVFVLNKVLLKYGMRTFCIPHARVPIVKSWDPKLRIASDINVNNTIALHNTRMIQTFVALDSRVRPFVMAIKHWSKCREINDAASGGTLSPYAWVNLAINFLQMRSPPILPILHPPISPQDAMNTGYGTGNVDLEFNDNIEQLRGFGVANTESLGYLLYAFFRTYAYEFDYRHQVVSLRQGCYLTKAQKGWDTGRPSQIFCIEEPFSTWLNLGHSANTTSVEGIRHECQRAFHILRDGGSYSEVCEVYKRPSRAVTAPNLTMSISPFENDHVEAGGNVGAANLNTLTKCNGKYAHCQPRSSSYSSGYGQTSYGNYYCMPGTMGAAANMNRRNSYDNTVYGNAMRNKGKQGHNPRNQHVTPNQFHAQQQHEQMITGALDSHSDSDNGPSASNASKNQQQSLKGGVVDQLTHLSIS